MALPLTAIGVALVCNLMLGVAAVLWLGLRHIGEVSGLLAAPRALPDTRRNRLP